MAMELIETIEVGSGGAASISFTSIPQDGVDLLCVLSSRTDRPSSTVDWVNLRCNGLTTSIYSYVHLEGSGSSTYTESDTTNTLKYAYVTASESTSNTFGSTQWYFSNYKAAAAKSISVESVSENNATAAYQNIAAQLFDSTAAITSIELRPNVGDFLQYSTASLYKIY